MSKRMSPRCRSALEQRLETHKAKLHFLRCNMKDGLRTFQSLLRHQKAVANGYSALPESKQVELASAISAGKFRSEKLCCIVVSELEKSSNEFADIFHMYLRTHRRLRGSYPTNEEAEEYT